jgi:hypothetical protein
MMKKEVRFMTQVVSRIFKKKCLFNFVFDTFPETCLKQKIMPSCDLYWKVSNNFMEKLIIDGRYITKDRANIVHLCDF